MAKRTLSHGRRRAIIENVAPQVDGGRFPIKRAVNETVTVEADVFTDGHDQLSCLLCYRKQGEKAWQETYMQALVNDRWRGRFQVTELGRYEYTVSAWVDRFKSWRHDLERRVEASDIALALQEGAAIVERAARRASGDDARWLKQRARALALSQHDASGGAGGNIEEHRLLGLDEELAHLMARYPNRSLATQFSPVLEVTVDPERARYSTWYELFPRSTAPEAGRHGTFKDVEARLPYVAGMGFDVLYLPPIHPIGRVNRKGRNNALVAAAGEAGVPWAIGSEEGGHKAIHPQLGSLEDFRDLVAAAKRCGMAVALDIAFQCAPDHPYVKQHPDWFNWRPDGTVQYAENPPKKYQDIYPFNFETQDWKALWEELKSVFDYWIEQGVRVFRVDNPHTKPFRLWEWLIGEIKKVHPETIFLAEAFTRPKVMHRLAKLGFTQSYTYFTWRNSKAELTEYLTELAQGEGREYFRPNFWPNTPDILHETLQSGGRPAFMARLVLAATMTANYGIYGPAFELVVNTAREPGSEEYLDSEKYQIAHWVLEQAHSLKDFIAWVNRIRRENPALQSDWSLRFHGLDNDQLLCYSKASDEHSNVILVVVNLDYTWPQSGWTDLDLPGLGVAAEQPFVVHDLLSNVRYTWHGPRNYVELNPQFAPAHIFRIEQTHSERDFDTFMG